MTNTVAVKKPAAKMARSSSVSHGLTLKARGKPKVAATHSRSIKGKPTMLSINPKVLAFSNIYQIDPIEKINLVRGGISSRYITKVSGSMGITKDALFKVLNFPKSTVDKKIVANQTLPIEQGERLIGMAKLVGQVEVMVRESGNPEGFNAARWMAAWIDQPLPALGGEKPAAYLDTVSGQEMISSLLMNIQSGGYA